MVLLYKNMKRCKKQKFQSEQNAIPKDFFNRKEDSLRIENKFSIRYKDIQYIPRQ